VWAGQLSLGQLAKVGGGQAETQPIRKNGFGCLCHITTAAAALVGFMKKMAMMSGMNGFCSRAVFFNLFSGTEPFGAFRLLTKPM